MSFFASKCKITNRPAHVLVLFGKSNAMGLQCFSFHKQNPMKRASEIVCVRRVCCVFFFWQFSLSVLMFMFGMS